ncbi:MAG: pilin [Candidatus Paceibacterota bacterium]|jgi:hypothetical protein
MKTRKPNTTNNKKLLSFFFIIFFLGLFFLPLSPVFAADPSSTESGTYTLLAPIPLSGGSGSDNSVQLGGEVAFANYLNNAFKIGITIAILLAVIMIVIGGIQWMGESVFGKESGKKKIQDALWGLVLALAIFLILNTINPDLVNLKLKVENLTETPALPPAIKATTIPDSVLREGLSSAKANDALTRAALAGITVNKDACPTGVRYQDVPGGCTTVAGLQQSAIEKLKALKAGCNCAIEITGGTEKGHSEGPGGHAGGKVVDLSLSSEVTSYIQRAGTRQDNYPGCSVGPKYVIDFTGGAITGQKSVFVNESIPGNPPHWHVCL